MISAEMFRTETQDVTFAPFSPNDSLLFHYPTIPNNIGAPLAQTFNTGLT